MSAVLHAREPSARYLEAAQPTLVRQFELLAMAPGGVARLRELILVLAVQGKLTRRDGLAEPAPALLARILKQKESLIAAGKIKRDKPLLSIDEADRPFDIPQSWCWVRLGGVTNYGSPTKGESIGPETWVLDLEDIEKSTGRLLHRVRRSERPSLSEKNSFQAGDVLYGKLRPYLNKVIVADEPGVCTTELVPFRCHGDWVPQYFKIALSSPPFLEYVNARSYGMKMPRLGTEDARSALLPLPPLEEQARIVARVDELMRLCDALEAKGRLEAEQHARLLGALLGTLTDSSTPEELAANWQRVADHFDLLLDRPEAVDALEQTILQLAVRGLLVPQDPNEEPASLLLIRLQSERRRLLREGLIKTDKSMPPVEDGCPFPLPLGWRWERLGNLANFIDYRGKTPTKTSAGVPLITAKNVRQGFINREPREYIAETAFVGWMTRGLPKVGDLLFTTEAPLGNVSAIDIKERFALAQRVICLSLFEPAMSSALSIFLQSPWMQSALAEQASGVTAQGIKSARLQLMPIPVPPLAEQQRITCRIEQLRRLCADLRQRLTASQTTQSHLAEALVESAAA